MIWVSFISFVLIFIGVIFFMASPLMIEGMVKAAYKQVRKNNPEMPEQELLIKTLQLRPPFAGLSYESLRNIIVPDRNYIMRDLNGIAKAGLVVELLIQNGYKPIKTIDELASFVVFYEKVPYRPTPIQKILFGDKK